MNWNTPSGKAARAVRALLSEKRESIETLSDATGIALSTLKRRLLGASPFNIDELGLIADHFGVSVVRVLTPMTGDDVAGRSEVAA